VRLAQGRATLALQRMLGVNPDEEKFKSGCHVYISLVTTILISDALSVSWKFANAFRVNADVSLYCSLATIQLSPESLSSL
jgi:hypothetical protein